MTANKEKKASLKRFGSEENVLGMYLNEIKRIPLLSREEENEIAKAAAKGDIVARNRLIKSNLRFVINIAKKYQGQGLSLDDLISEGNIGLINAVERYDVSKGYHFISYAVWWIRQSILKALCEKSRLIRLPANRVNELMKIEKARKLLSEQGSNEVEIREIARTLNMETKHVDEIIAVSREMVSLEKRINTAKGASMVADFVEDGRYAPPEQGVINESLEREIEKLLNTLDGNEAEIIRLHYGLGKRTPMSFKEIGERYNISKERVRQIEEKALMRLQHPSRIGKLQPYVA
jgi:RNA polymerase primary sigma factor